jgi:hypothetical protein
MNRKTVIVAFLLFSLGLFFLNEPLVNAASGEKTWGTSTTITQYIVVGGSTEIPKGDDAYVFQKQSANEVDIDDYTWQQMISGNMADLRNQIETKIPGTQVIWLRVHWDNDIYEAPPVNMHRIYGFYCEALVKNINAGQTGLEIVAIILAVAFLAVVITLCLTGAWVVWQVLSAAASLGPVATIGVGLIVLMLVLITLVIIFAIVFGGGVKAKGKKKSVSIGKT